MIQGITEEDEEMDIEEVDQFGPELIMPSELEAAAADHDTGESYAEPVSPISISPGPEHDETTKLRSGSGGVPLTAQALAKMQEEEDEKEKEKEKLAVS